VLDLVTVDSSQGRERDLAILGCVRLGRAANETMGLLGGRLDQLRSMPLVVRLRSSGFTRALLGVPYVHFELARTGFTEMAYAREFAYSLRGQVHRLLDPETTKQLEKDIKQVRAWRVCGRGILGKMQNETMYPSHRPTK
jgi:hypothetical protein